jgi:mono/diheme cytochrome c family protein
MIAQQEVSKRIVEARSISFILLILPVLAAGCAGATPAATAPPTTAPTPVPAATEVVLAVSDEQLAAAAAIGDIAAGEELFNQPVDGVSHSVSCSSCHSLDGRDSQDGPTLAGISVVAAVRVDGMSDVAYLRQSIADPPAFKVSGEWRFPMPHQYPDLFTEDQINNLIAFLLTR